ncbi:hypothetical protein L6164_017775 [Bauhinia variegata]|uniref:Uncharacterized protein n=1 Tax=Bauhinia variegata TaxID=167791 RepID=A0ACB9N965_BAUVA|nr:hypothetical protein L6164_017775 [Bauhinia variegata]
MLAGRLLRSMVTCITLNSSSRVVLASCRNAFTIVANLSLYAVALVVYNDINGKTYVDVENEYRWIACVSIFIGCSFVGVFHLAIKEPRGGTCKDLMGLLVQESFVLSGCSCYVLTRLVLNVSQAYLAFYVMNDLQMDKSAKALVPAIIYIISFIVSVILQEIAWTGRRLKAYYTIEGILWMLCGAAVLILPSEMNYLMYIASVFIGIANALMMVTGVSMRNFLIGENLNGCAFVCGSLSFLDKIICGLALYVLQSYQNSSLQLHGTMDSISVTRLGLGLVPAFSAIVGVAVTCTMDFHSPSSKPLREPLLV